MEEGARDEIANQALSLLLIIVVVDSFQGPGRKGRAVFDCGYFPSRQRIPFFGKYSTAGCLTGWLAGFPCQSNLSMLVWSCHVELLVFGDTLPLSNSTRVQRRISCKRNYTRLASCATNNNDNHLIKPMLGLCPTLLLHKTRVFIEKKEAYARSSGWEVIGSLSRTRYQSKIYITHALPPPFAAAPSTPRYVRGARVGRGGKQALLHRGRRGASIRGCPSRRFMLLKSDVSVPMLSPCRGEGASAQAYLIAVQHPFSLFFFPSLPFPVSATHLEDRSLLL